jgi:roadblock/LC7 domain-containing protein
MKSLIYNKPIYVLLFSFLLSCSYTIAQVRVVDNKGTIATIPIDWTRVLGTTKDIYNTDLGNVGIGIIKPMATLHNAGSTILGANPVSAVLSSSTALTYTDIATYTVFNYSASASGLALTLPSAMTDATPGRIVTIANTGATNSFSVSGVVLPAGYAQAFVWNGAAWSAQSSPVALSVPFSGLTAAIADNTLDNTTFAQTWSWNTATTQNPLTMNAPALTTGNALSITGGNALTSGSLINATAAVGATTTKGLLNIANTAASSVGKVASIQANSTAGSGLTVLANGNVGVGTSAPAAALHLQAGTAAAGTAPLKLNSGVKLTTAESGAVEYDGTHFYGTAGTNRLTLDNSALTGAGAGTAQAQTVTNSISALTTGMTVTWVPTASNTAADPTLAVGTATAKTVKKSGTASLAANDIALGVAATAVYDGTNWQLQNPQSATAWSLTGNAGTTAATNFMGTTDDNDVVFKRNNIMAGLLNVSLYNTSWGVGAFNTTATGNNNSVFGYQALLVNTSGTGNTAVGVVALKSNTSGLYNSAVGDGALMNSTTSNYNTALGYGAGSTLTTGNNNIAIGNSAQVPTATADYQLSIGNSIYGLNIGQATPQIGIGVSAPAAALHLRAGTAAAGTAPLKLSSGVNLTTAESGAVEFDGTHFYGTAGTNRLTLDNSALTGTAGGTADAQTVTNSLSALTKGMTVTWVPSATNATTTPTLAVGVSGTTGVTVKKSYNGALAALAAGDIVSGVAATAAYDGTNWVLQNSQTGGTPISSLTAAAKINAIDNATFAQTWNWSTATTQNPLALSAAALTTGNLLSLTGGSALTSGSLINATAAVGATTTKGLLNIANTAASSTGTVASIQANSTAGSGLTVLANGNVGVGTSAPTAALHLQAGTAATGTAPLKLNSGTNLTTAESGAVEFDGSHFYGTAGSNRLTLDNSALTGTAGGTADAQTVTNSLSALTKGMTVTWVPSATNATTTPTLAVGVSGTTGVTVKKAYNGALAALAAGDIVSGVAATAAYDGTNWVLQNSQTGGTPLSSLTDAAKDNTIDNKTFQQTWNWNTATVQNPFAMVAPALTTGTLLTLQADALTAGKGLSIYSNSSTATGNLLSVSSNSAGNLGSGGVLFNFGGAHTGTGLYIADHSLTGYATIISSSATTGTGLWVGVNSLTTGTGVSITSGSTTNTSTNGLLYVANNTSTTTGTVARIQANVTAGSGLTVLANGNVGVGTSAPAAALHLQAGTAAAGTAPLKLSSGVNLTTAESGAVEFDGSHFYGTAGTNRLTLDNSSLTGTAGGTADAQTVTNSLSALTMGMTVTWVPSATNATTTPTLAVGTSAAKTVKKSYNGALAALAAGDIVSGVAATAAYDGTNWVLQNSQTGGTPISSLTDAVKTDSIDNKTFAQKWNWSTATTQNPLALSAPALTTGTLLGLSAPALTTGTGLSVSADKLTTGSALSLSSTSTAMNAAKVLNVTTSGANATASMSTYAGYFANTKTGATSVNYGIYAEASGGATNNYALYAKGDVYVTGVISAPSDMRLKKDIETLTNVLSKIEQMRGVRYEYKDQQKYVAGPQVGVIAQELQKVFPELVRTGADGFLSVNYSQLTAVLIQAVKEQQQEIDLLKKQMKQVMEKLNIN